MLVVPTTPYRPYAKQYSGVHLNSFTKAITFQKLSEEGIQNLGPAVEEMALAEGLQGHQQAVRVRLNYLKSKS
jgi:histidinol dehydrogenase